MGKKMRRGKRVILRNTVHFGLQGFPKHTSFATDLSDKGVGVKTNLAFEPGTRLHLVIEDAGKRYGAKGIVVWSKRITPRLVQLVKTSMGIKFMHVDDGLIRFYEEKIKEELIEDGRFEIR
jgi:hypothetical protein